MQIHVEPSVYIPVPDSAGSLPQTLRRFERDLSSLSELLTFNGLSFAMTVELWDAFDNQVASLYAHDHAGGLSVPVAVARRLLAQRGVRVDLERLDGPEVLEDQLTRATPVYLIDDVWIAWTSLLAQHAASRASGPDSPVMSPSEGCTCMVAGAAGREGHRFRGYRLGSACPPDLVDPRVLTTLRARCEGSRPKFSYEKSGHLPHPAFKRVLERTAERSSIAVRMGTTRHKPNCADLCRMKFGSAFNEIEADICDGLEKFGATFHITAENAQEQATALTVLSREFYRHCRQEGFRISETRS